MSILESDSFCNLISKPIESLTSHFYWTLWEALHHLSAHKDWWVRYSLEIQRKFYQKAIMDSTRKLSSCADNLSNNNSLCSVLQHLIKSNLEHYSNEQDESGLRLHGALVVMRDNLEKASQCASEISQFAHEFDFSPEVQGNGYRSFLNVFLRCVIESTDLCKKLCSKRRFAYFTKNTYVKELESWSQTMASMRTILELLVFLKSKSDTGNLFVDMPPQDAIEHMYKINQYCFYSHCLGFQFHEEMRSIVKGISISMAAACDLYENEGSYISKAVTLISSSGRYAMDADLRARALVKATHESPLEFFKSFYNSTDANFIRKLPHFICPKMAVHRVIEIPPVSLNMEKLDGSKIEINPPSVQIGPQPLSSTLISAKLYDGIAAEEWQKKIEPNPPSPNLIIQIHGGGFVACSSNISQMFLRHWAVDTESPIFSIDYTLAPEAHFPRQVEEVFFAYCWALKNASILGSTAEKVVVTGDSAGGTLTLGLVIKCIQLGIRLPTGIVLMYTPVLIDFMPTPARVLTLMDPIIPFGFLMKCLKVYAGDHMPNYMLPGSKSEEKILRRNSSSDLARLDSNSSTRAALGNGTDTLSSISLNSKEEEMDIFTDNIENTPDDFGDVVSEVQPPSDAAIFDLKSDNSKEYDHTELEFNRTTLVLDPSPCTFATSHDFSESKQDPLLSPILVDEDTLSRFPPVSIMTTTLDPCLDDSIEFARRLKNVGVPLTLDILKDLPHAYLLFAHASKAAYDASGLCIKRLVDMLQGKVIN